MNDIEIKWFLFLNFLPLRQKKAPQSKFRTRSRRTEEVKKEEEEEKEEKNDGVFNIQRECNYEKLMEETYRFAPMGK